MGANKSTYSSGNYLVARVDFIYDFLIFPDLDSLLGGTFNESIRGTWHYNDEDGITSTMKRYHMKRFYSHKYIQNNENGAVAPLVGILMFLFIAFAALAIDVGHLYGVRNELQNAADGAALAGALVMRDPTDGTLNLSEAISEGTGAANLHYSGKDKITEVVVEVGHWCFSCPTEEDKIGKFTVPETIDMKCSQFY